MTTQCCPKCEGRKFTKICRHPRCKCHIIPRADNSSGVEVLTAYTSPVSEVIAEAVKDYERQIRLPQVGGNWITVWLTTTLSRVASVAREDTQEEDTAVIHGRSYDKGAQAMKEKILAALPEGFGWQVTSKTDVGGDTDNEYGFDVAIATVRRIITDLK